MYKLYTHISFHISTDLGYFRDLVCTEANLHMICAEGQAVNVCVPLECNMFHLCSLNWLPVCSWVQFKVLKFKAFHSMRPDYRKDHLSLIPIQSSRRGMLQVLSALEPQMTEARRWAFFLPWCSAYGTSSPP